MRQSVALLALLGAAPLLDGCVAAAVPAIAASTLVGSRVKARLDAQKRVRAAMPITVAKPKAPDVVEPAPDVPAQPQLAPGGALIVPDATLVPPPAPPPTAPVLAVTGVPTDVRFATAGAGGAQAGYAALGAYLTRVGADYREKKPLRQVVLADGASFTKPYFEPCGAKPPVVVIDVDETASASFGVDGVRGPAADESRWTNWEVDGAARVAPVPGAIEAIVAARVAGVDVIFNSNRLGARADDTVSALDIAGLGPVEHFKTLWMKGDDGGGSGKDNRRWAIASGYCVVALVGDQLTDFSDAFDTLRAPQRRAVAAAPTVARLWGNGWFALPNAVTGTARAGTR